MDLYHRPQNLFVAEFIGSPKMNVMPGKLVRAEPNYAVVDVHGEQVSVAVDARAASAGSAVTLGIRPEHLLAGEGSEGSTLHVKLHQMERLGDSSLLYLTITPDAPLVTLRLEGHATQSSGDSVALRLRSEQCHLFDSAGKAFKRTVQLPG
jgi:multiple sugar transport system ATP-binding protein